MSYEHINHVRDHSKAKGPARFVLLTIATRADEEGCAYPSLTCLAKDTGMAIRSVRRALMQIPKDEIAITQGGSQKGQKRRPAFYRIIMNETKRHDCAPNAHSQSSNRAPNAHSTNHDHAPIDTTTVRNRSHDCAPNAHVTVIEQSVEQKKRSRASPALAEIPLLLQTPDFLKAWADFDHYRRQGKKKKEWTARAKELALERCLELGTERAIAAIKHSMLNGWTGIFEPNNGQKPKPGRSVDEFGLPKL